MEMRAREDAAMAEDLIPPSSPIAASLHDRFLHSHCSSCFRPLPSSKTPSNSSQSNPKPTQFFPCAACNSSLLYCSLRCSSADSDLHTSSGECRLFLSTPSPSHPGDAADLRAALRLLRSFENLGLLPDSHSSDRIGGLLSSGLDEVLKEESEISERIREGAALMARARNEKGETVEGRVLWAVMTNAVEVEVGEGGAIGIAVYGACFSWFNHSCAPNACYRFEIASCFESRGDCNSSLFRVSPASNGEELEEGKAWIHDKSKLTHGMCRYGPKVTVRSIKPIKKGEEVCITYTDLLQPKAMRHFDLWLKYRFICCCERCNASPQMYIDYVLNCDARSLDSNHGSCRNAECEELADILDRSIAEYMSDGNPEACCEKLESMLSSIFQDSQFPGTVSKLAFRLHPLHYLSLNAYITLASLYRVLASNLVATDSSEHRTTKAFRMLRAAAAYSLLLAGATHHLFMCEPSLISSAAVFWVSAGESLISLVRSSYGADFCLASHHSEFTAREGSFVSLDEWKAASMRFLECISRNLTKSWPYLVQDFSYLENIRSPIDFSWWLGNTYILQLVACESSPGIYKCSEPNCRVEACAEDQLSLLHLSFSCLSYGKYLAFICYGQDCYLVNNAGNLLHGIS